MLVINKESRLHHLGQHVTLIPGVNEVHDAVWEVVKKIETVQIHLKDGTFEEVKTSKGKPTDSIDKMPIEKAAALVKETFDPKLLASWAETAKGPLAKVIATQVETIKEKLKGKPQE